MLCLPTPHPLPRAIFSGSSLALLTNSCVSLESLPALSGTFVLLFSDGALPLIAFPVRHHLHRGQAVLTWLPAWCLVSAQWQMTGTRAPSNHGQKVILDGPGCLSGWLGPWLVCLPTCMCVDRFVSAHSSRLPSPSKKNVHSTCIAVTLTDEMES